METIVGQAFKIIIGNPDVLKVWGIFSLVVTILMVVLHAWQHIEEWRGRA